MQFPPLCFLEHRDGVSFVGELVGEELLHRRAVSVCGVEGDPLSLGVATAPGVASHAIDEGTKHFIPELEDGFVGCFAGNPTAGNVFGFHRVDSNLFTVPLKKEIKMLACFPLLVSGQGQQSVTGIMAEDTHHPSQEGRVLLSGSAHKHQPAASGEGSEEMTTVVVV